MIVQRIVRGVALASLLSAAMLPQALAAQQVQTAHPDDIVITGPYQPQDKDERGLWMQMDEQERLLKTSNFVIRDAALNAYIHEVFCHVAGPRCSEVRVYLVRTPYFNAQTAPNGMMEVWSGLLLRVRNEAQLAAVLGHEYTHYQERHSLALFRNAKSNMAVATIFAALGVGLLGLAMVSAIFKFSRDQEIVADAGSVALMSRAGYDPHEAVKVWEQFRAEADATAAARATKSRKDKNGGLFGTHPPSAERVAALQTLIAAMPAGGKVGRETYTAALAAFWPSLIDDQIKLNDFGATDFLLASLASDGWTPELNYARGELYRSRGRPTDLAAATGFYRDASVAADAPVESWRGLGLSLLRSGSQAEGQAALKTYLVRKPDAADKDMIAMLAGA